MNTKNKLKQKIKNKKIVAETFFQIFTMVVSIFSFAFIIGGMTLGLTREISAAGINDAVLSGCCTKAKDGSICQDMSGSDEGLCKSGLIASGCSTIEQCQIGCCYDTENGICSFNSPKNQCEANSGSWKSDAQCNIEECQLGCCILGDQSSITTTRECTQLSRNYNFQKNFQALDADGSCSSHIGLSEKGACVTSANDYSGENDCTFTTKEKCNSGNFYSGYLCTAKALNSTCFPAKNTTCVEGKDQVYYLDTCGNIANVYDTSRFNDNSYWEKVILPSDSCSSSGSNNNPDCGNCDYTTGSMCYQVRENRDSTPTYGKNICRDLNCENNRKHGESWCISDYSNTNNPGVAPVGSRWFKGNCNNGEISIEPCADFNNERCIASTDSGGSGYSEAKCITNQWRSCIAANDKSSYAEVKSECEDYPDDCIMFSDIPGNEIYNLLPGFKIDTENKDQGSARGVGEDSNAVIEHCVPKYTPGMVFWSTTTSTSTSTSASSSTTSDSHSSESSNTGGSLSETTAICSLGSFTCVKTKKKACLTCDFNDDKNYECYDSNLAPIMLDGLNERCRAIGPCGSNINIAGEFGSKSGFKLASTEIDASGESSDYEPAASNLSEEYLNSLKEKAGLVKAGTLTSLVSAVVLSLVTGKAIQTSAEQEAAAQAGTSGVGSEEVLAYSQLGLTALQLAGQFKTSGTSVAGASATSTANAIPAGTNVYGGYFTSGTFNVPGYSSSVGGTPQPLVFTATKEVPVEIGKNAQGYLTITPKGGQVVASPTITATTPVTGTNVVIGLQTGSQIVSGTTAVGGQISIGMDVGSKLSYTLGGQTTTLEMVTNGVLDTTVNGVTRTTTSAIGANLPDGAVVTEVSKGVTLQQTPATTGTATAPVAGTEAAKTGVRAWGDLTKAGVTIVAAIAAYFIVSSIGKHYGWTPGETAAWASIAASTVTIAMTLILYDWGPWKIATLIIAVIMIIYSIISYDAEYKYYTLSYSCDPWEPPKKGECKLCNEDIRPCSEYRCKSLGMNCQYFNDNGEPGYCTESTDIWSAVISPWTEILTSGYKYTDVTETHFTIEATDNSEVPADLGFIFGIKTDKPAQCKIDKKHTDSFEEMSTSFTIDTSETGCASGSCNTNQGYYHKVALSPSIGSSESGTSTLSIVKGEENNYYIRCQNYAGQSNEAEFAVKVTADKGPDLTPPVINSFSPASGTYVKKGENSTSIIAWVNEPSECRYSQGTNSRYEEMNKTMACLSGSGSAILGNWPCYATFNNLTIGANKFYIQCQDQPTVGTEARRNINRNSKEYVVNLCSTGLNITSIEPKEKIITGKSPISMTLEVETTGCIDGGKSVCYYGGFGNNYSIPFLNTDSTKHSQEFTSLPSGKHNLTITCEDDVGNSVKGSAYIEVEIDNTAPTITRHYDYKNNLYVLTNENAECRYATNSSIGCSGINFEDNSAGISTMTGTSLTHTAPWKTNTNYYIKCKDIYDNVNSCSEIRTY